MGALGGAAAAGADYSTIINPSIKASSYYLAIPFGVTYKMGKYLSASVGGRTLSATNKVESSITMSGSATALPDQTLGIDAEYTASGFGWVFALNASTDDGYNFSVRYETQAELEFETKINNDDFGLIDTADLKDRRDLPAVLAFGVRIDACPKWKVFADANFYFQSRANWDTVVYHNGKEQLNKIAGNAAMYCIATQFEASTKLNIGAGLTYTKYSWKNQTGYYNVSLGSFEVVQANNLTINLGLKYNFTEKIAGTLAYMNVMYASDKQIKFDPLGTMVTVNNSANVLGYGINLTF